MSMSTLHVLHPQAGSQVVDPKRWPTFIETDEAVNKKKVTIYKPPTPEMIAYLDFSVNSNGLLTGVKVDTSTILYTYFFFIKNFFDWRILTEDTRIYNSKKYFKVWDIFGLLTAISQMSHAACNGYCRALKSACELYPSRHLALALDPFSGMGFVLWCLAG